MALAVIEGYEVIYSANSFAPRIALRNGDRYIGQLNFLPNDATLPPDELNAGIANLYYHLDDFRNAIDLLRNEGPMYLLFSGSGHGFENAIRTTEEIVGEEEAIPPRAR